MKGSYLYLYKTWKDLQILYNYTNLAHLLNKNQLPPHPLWKKSYPEVGMTSDDTNNEEYNNRVHHLVAHEFLPPPQPHQKVVDHLNFDK